MEYAIYEQESDRCEEIRELLKKLYQDGGRLDIPLKCNNGKLPVCEIASLINLGYCTESLFNQYENWDLMCLKQVLRWKQNQHGSLMKMEGLEALDSFVKCANPKAVYLMLQYGQCDIDAERFKSQQDNFHVLIKEDYNPLLTAVKWLLETPEFPVYVMEDILRMLIICSDNAVDQKIADPGLRGINGAIALKYLKDCSIQDIVKYADKDICSTVIEARNERKVLMQRGWDGNLPIPMQFVQHVFKEYCNFDLQVRNNEEIQRSEIQVILAVQKVLHQ